MKNTEMSTENWIAHTYVYQAETAERFHKIPSQCVNKASHRIGLQQCEPLIIMLDALIRYAKAHEKRFESKLSEDYVLGPAWLKSARGVRELLNGDGAVAHEINRSTDTKDNSAAEGMFWDACAIAGFKEEDFN